MDQFKEKKLNRFLIWQGYTFITIINKMICPITLQSRPGQMSQVVTGLRFKFRAYQISYTLPTTRHRCNLDVWALA